MAGRSGWVLVLALVACGGTTTDLPDAGATDLPVEVVGDVPGDTPVDVPGDVADAPVDPGPTDAPPDPGSVDVPPPDLPAVPMATPAWQEARQQEWLDQACADPLAPGSLESVLAHLSCEARGGAAVAAGAVPADAWDPLFLKMWRLRDTSDFTATMLVNLVYAHEGHPAVPEALWQKTGQALRSFKFWFSDPTPVREFEGAPVVDDLWYWSENHVLIFRTCEYLAGQRWPDEVFEVTGETGAWHKARAEAEIRRWLEERARWGFTEWHSNVYYNWDMQPLLALVEWAEDPDLARRAAMVLDLVWLDVALHVHRGTFGATHGRSYIKDKAAADTEDTFAATKLFFNDTTLPWGGGSRNGVTFARARKYAMPRALVEVALGDDPMTDRERMNLPLPEEPTASADTPPAAPPYGLTYGEEHLPLWWSMAAFTTWPLLPVTLDVANRYKLWDGQFKSISAVAGLVDMSQPIEVILEDIFPLYQVMWRVFSAGLMKEVHTKTHRTAHYMLSSAQDYRKGGPATQVHSWQATLSERALIFTQQPGYLPVKPGDPIPADWNWQAMDEDGGGYWTGEGSMPRIGQDRNVAVILYAPQFQAAPLGLENFNYRNETHAYVPQSHLDEVVQAGNWTFARKDDGYVALWSFRPTSWRTGQPQVFQNGDQPFDLVAEGAQNAWVVELGSLGEWESFAAFRAAVGAAAIAATPVADRDADGYDDGFAVAYESPSRGKVEFDWHGPLTVAGQDVPLRWEWRYDNPFVRTRFDDAVYDVQAGGQRLYLDFGRGLRLGTAPK